MEFSLAIMLRESARRAPGHPAVIHGESRISDAELDALSDRVAASLTSASLVPGDRVGPAAAEHSPVRHRLLRDP